MSTEKERERQGVFRLRGNPSKRKAIKEKEA